MHSKPAWFGKGGSHSEQLSKTETVLPSEFYTIPPTSRANGLSGYFLSSSFGAVRDRIRGKVLASLFVAADTEQTMRFRSQPEAAQQLVPWSKPDCQRLCLADRDVADKKLGNERSLQKRKIDLAVR